MILLRNKTKKSHGFTLIELLVVVGIMAILFSMGSIVFGSFNQKNQHLMEARKIESVIGEARLKSMSGFTLGGIDGLNFGVHFDADRYILFSGTAYIDKDSDQEYLLPQDISFEEVQFPSQSLVFNRITGDVVGYSVGQDYLVLTDQKTSAKFKISVNKLGTVKIEKQ